jgi:hypothetical protein
MVRAISWIAAGSGFPFPEFVHRFVVRRAPGMDNACCMTHPSFMQSEQNTVGVRRCRLC